MLNLLSQDGWQPVTMASLSLPIVVAVILEAWRCLWRDRRVFRRRPDDRAGDLGCTICGAWRFRRWNAGVYPRLDDHSEGAGRGDGVWCPVRDILINAESHERAESQGSPMLTRAERNSIFSIHIGSITCWLAVT